MVRRRYETTDKDDYDHYTRFQDQYRRTGYNSDAANRYQAGRRSLQTRQLAAKSKILTVYANQNGNKPPVIITFKSKQYQKLDKLLDDITVKHRTTVNFLFKWPNGEPVCDTSQIDEDMDTTLYVCSERRKLYTNIDYGGIKYGASSCHGSAFTGKYSSTSYTSSGTLSSQKHSPTAVKSNGSMNGVSKLPTAMNVVSYKTGEQKTPFIDRTSKQSFEELLEIIRDNLGPSHPPIHTLYCLSTKKPYRKIKINSISSLRGAWQSNDDTFLACGKNEEPDEKMLVSRDSSPMRNGYQQRQKNASKQNGHYNDRTRQHNSHVTQQESHVDTRGRSYQRHPDEDEYEDETEQEDYEQEPSYPPPRRVGQRQDHSPRRNSKQPAYQDQRRNEDDEDDGSPRRHNKHNTNRRSQRRSEDDDEEEVNTSRDDRRENKRRQQTREQTPPRRDENRHRETNDNDDEGDSDDDREKDHPSDEEMQERIEEMEKIDPNLDRGIHY